MTTYFPNFVQTFIANKYYFYYGQYLWLISIFSPGNNVKSKVNLKMGVRGSNDWFTEEVGIPTVKSVY